MLCLGGCKPRCTRRRPQVDQWLGFAPALAAGPGLLAAAAAANEYLATRTYLVGHRLTLADVAVWGELAGAGRHLPAAPPPRPHASRETLRALYVL